ncbi:MAG: phosphatase PAP2 family protein [Candidatus Lokiarchaeota archaeon]|nr:phosphatase PAP2 family protein [Candidatus Lokiarchaeota archaeon]
MAEQALPSRSEAFSSRAKAWDIKWFRRINGWSSPAASFLGHYTHVASSWTWAIITVAMFFIAWLGRVPFAWAFVKHAVANTSSLLVVLIIKRKINRIRPCYELDNVVIRTAPQHYRGSSFPSGHVQFFLSNMLVLATVASYFAGAGVWSWMLPLSLAMDVLVALSRVYVGVHYPTDVLAGFFSGLLIYCFTMLVMFPLWNVFYSWIDIAIH